MQGGAVPADGASEELNIGLLLFLPYRALGVRIDQALTAAGYGDMTEAQSRIFQRIGAQGSRLTDLAEQAQVTKQTAGILVDQLEALGYVERTPDPDDGRVVLTDFGLATMVGEANVTRPGLILGSPAYIAPERARDGHSGPESDLWSLGATLYAAVEGHSPYARSTAIATLTAPGFGPVKPSVQRVEPLHVGWTDHGMIQPAAG